LSWEEASAILKDIPQDGRDYSVTQFASSKRSNVAQDEADYGMLAS